MKKSIRILNSSHAAQYHQLLKLAFANAVGFTARSEALVWSQAESHYPTLGVFHDEQLISVMRLEWILSKQEFQFKLHTNLEFPHVTYPVAYLTRAGTLPEVRSGGFNSLLRYHCLKIAQSWGVPYVFGTMVEGSPRVFTLQEMGYELVKNTMKWNSYFVSEKPALIASLDLPQKGAQALAHLEKVLGPMIQDYAPEFEIENLKIQNPHPKQRPA